MLKTLFAALVAVFVGAAAQAESMIVVHDAYVITSRMNATASAAFMVIANTGDTDDTVVAARSDAAELVELHTHIMEDGIAKMRRVEGGFVVPAGDMHLLERGSDHVMLMGLTTPLEAGMTIQLTLVFASGKEMTLDLPVYNADEVPAGRHTPGMNHDAMNHGAMSVTN